MFQWSILLNFKGISKLKFFIIFFFLKKTNILKLWKNGFTVDDNELRSYNDPANKLFLASIQRGEPPRELILQAEGAEVHLDMQDHRDEEYEPPKNAKPKLYNEGYKLGSPTPTVVSNASPNDVEKNENFKDELDNCHD